MKNYLSNAAVLTLFATSLMIAGRPSVVGGLLIIPKTSAGVGEKFTALYKGEFSLPKAAADQATALQKAYWDVAGEVITTVAENNKLVGVFATAVAEDDTTAAVILSGELI